MKRRWNIIYSITMALLAIISSILIIYDFAHEINIMDYPFNVIDNTILVIFAVDYFTRLFLAKDKKSSPSTRFPGYSGFRGSHEHFDYYGWFGWWACLAASSAF